MRVFRPLICIFVFLKCVNYFAEFGVCSAAKSKPANESSTHQPSSGSGPNLKASAGSGTDSNDSRRSAEGNSESAPASQDQSSTNPPKPANPSADSNGTSGGVTGTGTGGSQLSIRAGHSTSNPSSGSKAMNIPAITLDIKGAKASTDQFEHEKNGKVVTYKAKGDNRFTSVIYNGKTTIWSADNANNFSKMVVLDGRGKKDKTVTIHLDNCSKKVFKKDKNNPWNKVVQSNPNVSCGMAAVN